MINRHERMSDISISANGVSYKIMKPNGFLRAVPSASTYLQWYMFWNAELKGLKGYGKCPKISNTKVSDKMTQ